MSLFLEISRGDETFTEWIIKEPSIVYFENWNECFRQNFKGDNTCLCEALYCDFSLYGDMCDLDLYFGDLWGKRFMEFFTPNGATLEEVGKTNGQTIDDGLWVYKSIRMGFIVSQGIQC